MILNTWSRIGTNFKCRNRCTTVVVSVWCVCVQNGETKESEQKTGKCVCVRERERERETEIDGMQQNTTKINLNVQT
jgi:hypothetical protein